MITSCYTKVIHRWFILFGASRFLLSGLEALIDVENVEFRIILSSSTQQMNNNIKPKAERNIQ